MTDAVAVVLFVAITTYAVFGGADFGAGFWDLVAGGADKGKRPRAVIAHAIEPVWEANHVWLIFTLVVLWTAFSEAFASIMLTLFVPLTLAALGIVLRGSGFVFRKNVLLVRDRRNFGVAFAASSVLVPYCFGAVAGAIASGRVPAGGAPGEPWSSWVNPTAVLGGLLAVTVCAYLGAVYLSVDARRLGDPEMATYFRRRGVATAVVAGVVAFGGIFVLRDDARYVFDGLTARGLPLVIVSAVCGIASLVLLLRGTRRFTRVLAAGAVATVVGAWGVAQWPYMLPKTLTVDDAAAPSGTLEAVLVVFGVAAVLVIPSLIGLYVLDQRSLLDDAGGPARAAGPHTSGRAGTDGSSPSALAQAVTTVLGAAAIGALIAIDRRRRAHQPTRSPR
jgi:cytochrome d ubiquinol oxidase subunit II